MNIERMEAFDWSNLDCLDGEKICHVMTDLLDIMNGKADNEDLKRRVDIYSNSFGGKKKKRKKNDNITPCYQQCSWIFTGKIVGRLCSTVQFRKVEALPKFFPLVMNLIETSYNLVGKKNNTMSCGGDDSIKPTQRHQYVQVKTPNAIVRNRNVNKFLSWLMSNIDQRCITREMKTRVVEVMHQFCSSSHGLFTLTKKNKMTMLLQLFYNVDKNLLIDLLLKLMNNQYSTASDDNNNDHPNIATQRHFRTEGLQPLVVRPRVVKEGARVTEAFPFILEILRENMKKKRKRDDILLDGHQEQQQLKKRKLSTMVQLPDSLLLSLNKLETNHKVVVHSPPSVDLMDVLKRKTKVVALLSKCINNRNICRFEKDKNLVHLLNAQLAWIVNNFKPTHHHHDGDPVQLYLDWNIFLFREMMRFGHLDCAILQNESIIRMDILAMIEWDRRVKKSSSSKHNSYFLDLASMLQKTIGPYNFLYGLFDTYLSTINRIGVKVVEEESETSCFSSISMSLRGKQNGSPSFHWSVFLTRFLLRSIAHFSSHIFDDQLHRMSNHLIAHVCQMAFSTANWWYSDVIELTRLANHPNHCGTILHSCLQSLRDNFIAEQTLPGTFPPILGNNGRLYGVPLTVFVNCLEQFGKGNNDDGDKIVLNLIWITKSNLLERSIGCFSKLLSSSNVTPACEIIFSFWEQCMINPILSQSMTKNIQNLLIHVVKKYLAMGIKNGDGCGPPFFARFLTNKKHWLGQHLLNVDEENSTKEKI